MASPAFRTFLMSVNNGKKGAEFVEKAIAAFVREDVRRMLESCRKENTSHFSDR